MGRCFVTLALPKGPRDAPSPFSPLATHHTGRVRHANAAAPTCPADVAAQLPGEPFDAPEDLLKERPGQVTLGKLEHEVPRMPDQAPAGLEEPLLEARQGPSLGELNARRIGPNAASPTG